MTRETIFEALNLNPNSNHELDVNASVDFDSTYLELNQIQSKFD